MMLGEGQMQVFIEGFPLFLIELWSPREKTDMNNQSSA